MLSQNHQLGHSPLHQHTAGKKIVPVGIAEMKLSSNPEEVIVTYSLGSCLGVSLYDPHIHLGGMIHCKLATYKQSLGLFQSSDACFVDIGLPKLIHEMIRQGARKRRLQVKLAGCGNNDGHFNIGWQNSAMAYTVLDQFGLKITAEDTGGHKPRTLSLQIDTGRTYIKSRSSIIAL
jgi:chemotaxis protein CheD